MRLLVGTRDGLRDSEGALLALGGRSIRALAGNPDNAWMVVDGREVWRLRDGRSTQATTAAAPGDPALTCAVPTPTGVLLGTEGAHLRQLDDAGLVPVAGFDQAEGREHWFTPWGGPPATRSIVMDEESTLYVNVHVGGVLRSDDDARPGRRRRWTSAPTRIRSSRPRAMTACCWPQPRAAWPFA